LRVEPDKYGSLVLIGNLDEGIEEAFKEKRYVEAFVLLHAQIDWWMESIYANYRRNNGLVSTRERMANVDYYPYRYMDSANFLKQKGIIDPRTHSRIANFNNLRDRLIHRLVYRGYQRRDLGKKANRITPSDVSKGFENGRKLVSLLLELNNRGIAKGHHPE